MTRRVRSLLVANRGEIAVRIMRTCKRLGIRAIAVYSDADRGAAHVALADEAVRIGPAPARDSYLRADAIMAAAARSGAEAIHPGYGFLSERPDLPELCAAAGLVWVGPSAGCIAAMGPKIGAKLIAARAGVPSVPGYAGEDQSLANLAEQARRIGFPVMVKASAGGGGKGMRRVFAADELGPALDLARREAEAAFGDPALLIERLVLQPRHLEVQVAGDKHGNVVHLFERDCSVQRNHQKVLEEAPAPNLRPDIRAKLLERGVALARAIGYDNLGTVEFILEQGQDEPWFLEMNTRLQVEHPVTEAITGQDLVEWQLRIACGEPLPLRQDAITEHGHAIEARITAEQADHGFRPDAGPVVAYREPAGIRVDSGIRAGSEVTLFYDSLLAKAIGVGPTRDAARARLVAGLRDFTIFGPATTLPFLADALEHPAFVDGHATTRFIEDAFPDGWAPARRHAPLALAVAAVLAAASPPVTIPSAWSALTGFRVLGPAGGLAETRLLVSDGAADFQVAVLALPGGWRRVRAQGGDIDLRVQRTGESLVVEADGRVTTGSHHVACGTVRLSLAGEAYQFTVAPAVRARSGAAGGSAGSGAVLAPMPGVVAEVRVAMGEIVAVGQVVAVLESMKLFTALTSAVAGRVSEIACRPGETAAAGKRLLMVEPAANE